MKILVMGLPGSGKTTFARFLAEYFRCVHFNADDIRENVNKDLGFSLEDRIEQARRMGHLCNIAGRWGSTVVADLVCPTEETREAFGADFVVWMNTTKQGRFEDTNAMFVQPDYDYRIDDFAMQMMYHAVEINKLIHKTATKKYYIRYNTHHGESDLVWRIFENGTEHLVKNFVIDGPLYGESTIEHDVQKWNVSCEGIMTIVDGVCHIRGK